MAEAPRPIPTRTDATAKPGFEWLVRQEQRVDASNTLIDFGEDDRERDDRGGPAAAIRHHPRLGPIPAVADDARPGMKWLVQQQQAVTKSSELLIEFD